MRPSPRGVQRKVKSREAPSRLEELARVKRRVAVRCEVLACFPPSLAFARHVGRAYSLRLFAWLWCNGFILLEARDSGLDVEHDGLVSGKFCADILERFVEVVI